jgi:gamma-glutamyltranspeptidase / glutathione hydrolase
MTILKSQYTTEHLVQNWNVRKPVARSSGGIVATQNRIAGEAGIRMLKAGGNAVDAAVATGLALAAVEPWNSGLGGVGFMLVYLAKEQRVHVVDFGPISPGALNPADFPLVGGYTSDLFTWPTVKDDRNVHGPNSVVVPGQIAGLSLALEKFGKLQFREVIQPAITLADQGMAVDWYLTLKIAITAKELSRYPSSASVYLPGGFPPVTPAGAALERLHLKGLANTMRRLADAGPRDYYEGEIAQSIARDIKAMGGILSADDLKRYHARIVEPINTDYHGAHLALAPNLTAGPSMQRTIDNLREFKFSGKPDADAFLAYAKVLREAFAVRLATMGENSDHRDPACTTHFNVVDRDGNMVAHTQTLLSVFGSKVVLPETGILMNNGIMWFDPRPGTPNSLAPNKRALNNMCPVIAHKNGKAWFALGASGGRKIFPAVLQLTSFMIDHGLTLDDAFHHPRIDASGGDIVGVDPRMPEAIIQKLKAEYPVDLTELVVYPTNFACPSSVYQNEDGEHFGIGDVMSPWSGAVAE